MWAASETDTKIAEFAWFYDDAMYSGLKKHTSAATL